MKLLLSTSNIMGGGSSIRKSSSIKSNAEFITSLRANFAYHSAEDQEITSGQDGSTRPSYQTWTRRNGDVLEIPKLDVAETALQEEREQYDITAKLFFLPGAKSEDRPAQIREAVALISQALAMPSIDLLILSFPGVYFDEQEDCPEKLSTRGPIESEPEPLGTQIAVWRELEALHGEGFVARIGVAEFGTDRLEALLDQAKVKPSVDQINLRDCCSVPKDLLALAKARNVELLVHNDCSNILPTGTLRDLLGDGPSGAGVLLDAAKTGEKRKQLHDVDAVTNIGTGPLSGEVQPQWVVKYTAVIRDRGVVESKGYFAVTNLNE